MSSIPHLITAHSKSDDWLFYHDAAKVAGTEALRDACVAGVLEDEIFWHFGELPERMKALFMDAIRVGDERTVGRIMCVAFDRAVNEDLEMRVDRIRNEAMLGADHE